MEAEDGAPVEREKQTRQNRSVVHQMFDFVQSVDGTKTAHCRLCTAKYKHNPLSTTNLLTHCRTRHMKQTQELGMKAFNPDMPTSFEQSLSEKLMEPASIKCEQPEVQNEVLMAENPHLFWTPEAKRAKMAFPEREDPPRRDENASMGRYWQLEVESMAPEQQMYAKKAISDIIFEGQMGNLWRNAVQIRPQPRETGDSGVPSTLCPLTGAFLS